MWMKSGLHRPTVDSRSLFRELRTLGVSPGDRMIVHTSLSSIGYVEDGPAGLLQALQQAVMPGGLLLIPAFTYGRQPFNPEETLPVIGSVPVAAISFPGFFRSVHPTHSFAVSGSDARGIAESHRPEDAIDSTSPLNNLYETGGSILLLGVDHRSNTAIHLAERVAGVPYADQQKAWLAKDGGVQSVDISWRPGCSEAFNRVRSVLPFLPGIHSGHIGYAPSTLLPMRPFVDRIARRLKIEPFWLLGSCAWCRSARLRARRTGPED